MKNKNILLLISSTLLSSNIALASATPYVGGSIGFGGYQSEPGYLANIFGGYGATFGKSNRFYLGGELGLHVGHFSRFETTYGLGLSLLPGLKLSDSTMIFTRFGIDTNYLSHDNQSFEFRTQIGLGLQTSLTKKIDLRGEYVTSGNGTGSYNLGLIYKFD